MAALRTISTPTPLGYGRSRLFNFVRLFETHFFGTYIWYSASQFHAVQIKAKQMLHHSIVTTDEWFTEGVHEVYL